MDKVTIVKTKTSPEKYYAKWLPLSRFLGFVHKPQTRGEFFIDE